MHFTLLGNKNKIFFVIATALIFTFSSVGLFTNRANATGIQSISITPLSSNVNSISITFSQPVSAGDIADIEIYNSNKQKVWQDFAVNGGTTFSKTASQLSNGTYTIAVGLFKPNWSNNYAWFSNVATITIPHNTNISAISPTASSTPSPIPIDPRLISAANDAYNNWKQKYTSSVNSALVRVVRPENNNDTVSEGIGYGMLLSEFAGDEQIFKGLWSYAQKYFDTNGLMHWDINANGNVIGAGAATDADEDIAYALVLANTRWPNHGYNIAAKNEINAIMTYEVSNDNYIKPGDTWGNTTIMNASYITPSYYNAFGQVTGNNRWNDIANQNNAWLARAANASTGLLPDWLNKDFSAANVSWDTHADGFYYDALRAPIRLLLAYKTNTDSNSQNILTKESNFFSSIGTVKLTSGYTIYGNSLSNYLDTAFLSAYAAAGQVNTNTTYAKDVLNTLINTQPTGYFGTSLRAITLFIAAGAPKI